ncbi:J domain-containing protein [Mycena chlorophos]|uniref:J domain-containing protein n=1 Tax=Mycena chlorophos TaxID=658473 RepID=A0A8H6S5I9_MYCCL|nr:J domain-containing protein [Mycena chlorophos]
MSFAPASIHAILDWLSLKMQRQQAQTNQHLTFCANLVSQVGRPNAMIRRQTMLSTSAPSYLTHSHASTSTLSHRARGFATTDHLTNSLGSHTRFMTDSPLPASLTDPPNVDTLSPSHYRYLTQFPSLAHPLVLKTLGQCILGATELGTRETSSFFSWFPAQAWRRKRVNARPAFSRLLPSCYDPAAPSPNPLPIPVNPDCASRPPDIQSRASVLAANARNGISSCFHHQTPVRLRLRLAHAASGRALSPPNSFLFRDPDRGTLQPAFEEREALWSGNKCVECEHGAERGARVVESLLLDSREVVSGPCPLNIFVPLIEVAAAAVTAINVKLSWLSPSSHRPTTHFLDSPRAEFAPASLQASMPTSGTYPAPFKVMHLSSAPFVSTIRSAVELKSVFDQIQAAERAGNLSPEEKRKLEEQAAEKGLQALFKGAKLEIESVLRETCDRILEDSTVPRDKTILRAAALQILGEAYSNVSKDGQASIGDDSDYVRVETKQSRTPNKRDSRVPPTSPR